MAELFRVVNHPIIYPDLDRICPASTVQLEEKPWELVVIFHIQLGHLGPGMHWGVIGHEDGTWDTSTMQPPVGIFQQLSSASVGGPPS